MNDVNDDLYREQLLDIYRNPSHRGKIENPTVESHEKNPFCGDNLELQLRIEDGVIKDAAFDGESCFVTIASGSLVTDKIIGMKVSDVLKITEEDVLKLLGVELTTSRVKCATLILTAINSALKDYERN